MHLPTSPLQRLLAITASVLACATPAQALVAPPLIDVTSYSGTDGGPVGHYGYDDNSYSGQRSNGLLSGGEGDPPPQRTGHPPGVQNGGYLRGRV